MTPEREAYEAGAYAREHKWHAGANPFDDWRLGVAWAAGWRGITADQALQPQGKGAIVEQTAVIRRQIWGEVATND